MALIPSSPSEWSHKNNQIDGQKEGSFSLNSTITTTNNNMGSIMDQKIVQIPQNQEQKQQNQEALRCPRCDSSNTKFCYYNNYSLSQPRHFCKGCKRYWTRGGTLRNVPVGGGCRKNKRIKINPTPNPTPNPTTNASNNHQHHVTNPLFFGMPTNPNSEINFPFSRYDLQNPSQIHDIGLGFSSSGGIFQNLMSNSSNSSNPLISSTHYTSNSPFLSSLLASTHEMKGNSFHSILPSYEDDLQMKGGGMFNKDVKMELEGQNRNLGNQHNHSWTSPSQNHQDEDSSDPSLLWGGAWLDPSINIGSSVPN